MRKLDFDKKIKRVEEFAATYPSYYAVIPSEVRYSKISIEAKFLYGEITTFCDIDRHFTGDIRYFAHLCNVTPREIVTWIKELKEQDFISCKVFSSGNIIISI